MENKIVAMLIIISALAISSCKKDDNHAPQNNNGSATTAIITSGTWRVSYYHESNDDHTANFSGYVFTFDSSGKVTAIRAGDTTNGTWSLDNSKNELHISLGSNDPLKDLSKGWLILSQNSAEIQLKDDDVSNTEEVHFTKN